MTGHGATFGSEGLPESTTASRAAGFGPVRHVAVTGSTNRDLVEEARAGGRSACVLVADHQTAGRGRLDRVWEDRPGGALLFSLRVPTSSERAHDVVAALVAGARAAVDVLVPVTVKVKWPNDLVVTDGPRPGKLAGVLAELIEGDEPVVVVGLGCNIEPIDTQPESTSLAECGRDTGRDALLAAILTAAGERRGGPERVHAETRRHSATLGTHVRVEIAGREPFTGTAVELRADGQLIVVDDDGVSRVVGSGDVVKLRQST